MGERPARQTRFCGGLGAAVFAVDDVVHEVEVLLGARRSFLGVPRARSGDRAPKEFSGSEAAYVIDLLVDVRARTGVMSRDGGGVVHPPTLHTHLHVTCGPSVLDQEDQQAKKAGTDEQYRHDDVPGGTVLLGSDLVGDFPVSTS